jgi:hypothetical protein
MGLYGSTDGGSSAGIGNFKRIFTHRKGQEKTRETLPLKEKLSFGRGQGQVGLYGRTVESSSVGKSNFKRIFNHRKGRKKLVRHYL